MIFAGSRTEQLERTRARSPGLSIAITNARYQFARAARKVAGPQFLCLVRSRKGTEQARRNRTRQASSIGNRALLSDRVSSQTNGRSYNVANSAQENFADTGEVILGQGKDLFNSQWLAGNALNDQAAVLDSKAKGNATESRIITNGLQLRDRSKLGIANKPGAASEMKQQADVADKRLEFEDRAGKVQRYQMRLEQRAAGRTPGASPYSQIQSGIAGRGNHRLAQ